MNKQKRIISAILLAILCLLLTACSSEPQLVVTNAYKHRGDYNGNYSVNAYTFHIKNKSGTDIESVDYFIIYFFNGRGECVANYEMESWELRSLALDAGDSWSIQIDIPAGWLSYDDDWSYDFEYNLRYYD